MREFYERDVEQIARLLQEHDPDAGKYDEAAELLAQYYSAEQIKRMIENPDERPSVLVYDPNQARLKRVGEDLANIADLILVCDRNRIDSVCEESLGRVRLILAAGKGLGADPALNTQEIRLLRLLFPGYVVVYVDEVPSIGDAFRYGKTDCDGLCLVRELPEEVRGILAKQDDVAKILETDWLGLLCAFLTGMGELDSFGWPDFLEFYLECTSALTPPTET